MDTENEESNQKIQDEKQAVESSCNRPNCNIDLAKCESLAKIALNAAGVIVIVSPMISTFLIFMYLIKYHYFVLIQSHKNIYIVKHRKDCEKLVSAPSEKYCSIIKLPKKYIK